MRRFRLLLWPAGAVLGIAAEWLSFGWGDPRHWVRFVAWAGKVDRIAKGRGRAGQEPGDAWLALERLLLAVADSKALRLLAS